METQLRKGETMKKTIKNAIEIKNEGGAIMSSEWTTGRGRYINKRPIPAHCAELPIAQALREMRGETLRAVKRIAKAHPRAIKVIALVDRRGLNAAIRKNGER